MRRRPKVQECYVDKLLVTKWIDGMPAATASLGMGWVDVATLRGNVVTVTKLIYAAPPTSYTGPMSRTR